MERSDFLAKLLSKDVRDRLPDLESLALGLKIHRAKREGRSVADVAEELKLGKDALYRRLAKIEEAFPGSAGAGDLYASLEVMLDRFNSLMNGDAPKIRLGSSKRLAKIVAPTVLKTFEKAEYEVFPGDPGALRRRAEVGDLDLVMCSCEPGPPPPFCKILASIGLPLRMIVPRDHRLAKELIHRPELFGDNVLHGMTVVHLEPHPDRLPFPLYPEKLIRKAREVRLVDNYQDMHDLVKAGGDVVGFSFGELLDDDEQKGIDVISLPREYSYRLRVCLLRSERSRQWRGKDQSAVIERLAKGLIHALKQLEAGVFNDESVERIPREWVLYHVGPLTSMGTSFGWSKGRLTLQMTRDGVVKGVHKARPPGSQGEYRDFEVFGQAIRNPNAKSEIQIVWQGRSDNEVYAAGFTSELNDLQEGDLIGVWVGRSMVDPRQFHGATGYMVATPKVPGTEEDAQSRSPELLPEDRDKLEAKVEQHAKRFGAMALLPPREMK